MDYKIAKQLKDAGFPQPVGKEFAARRSCGHEHSLENDGTYLCDSEVVFLPTLEELIEAFGDSQSIRIMSYYIGNDLKWQADTAGNFRDWISSDISEIGNTPKIAVAKLWLALHPITP